MKFKVAILTLCLLVIATHPACSIDEGAENLIDARYVYAVPYQRLLELGTDGLGMPLPEIVIAGLKIHLIILFPELYATNMNITYGIKRDSLPDACQHDLNIIELAEKYGLDYDRKWLLYWWPEKGSILSPKEYMTLVFYTTFMPPKYRDIFLNRNIKLEVLYQPIFMKFYHSGSISSSYIRLVTFSIYLPARVYMIQRRPKKH